MQYNTSNSLWPLYTSFSMFLLLLTFYYYLKTTSALFDISYILLMINSKFWFGDLIRESFLKGTQNFLMQSSLKFGMIFFIVSEFFFFISFFWSYFHFMFMQSGEVGMEWPPKGVYAINCLSVPMLNSFLLLSSGVSLTVSHNMLLFEKKEFKFLLLMTAILGVLFSYCQYWEYKMLDFLWSDSYYGSIFFLGTGFHGFHVIMGSLILLTIWFRSLYFQILTDSMMFELGAWYWHFVDVIWMILFIEFYWWSKH
uniref:Cytochrome c oxidase subunit 3 n=1 Tax=Agamermis sp. BH-2006 TaxID=390897 RepID=Q0Z879_9BILA|nr:cytochrome c oxidase subunit III [Agamermis sp. BH-2006]ABG38304.1 cytochrome c oxidase subunit III [Agamermis sp. BH-2006]